MSQIRQGEAFLVDDVQMLPSLSDLLQVLTPFQSQMANLIELGRHLVMVQIGFEKVVVIGAMRVVTQHLHLHSDQLAL